MSLRWMLLALSLPACATSQGKLIDDAYDRLPVDARSSLYDGENDIVIARNDGTPAYNLAVVVDDHDTGVEEVVRGDDLLFATPAQILIAHSLGYAPPSYAHVPVLRGPDGGRLSKRHGAITLGERLALGQSAAEVRSELAASVGLCTADERPSMAELLARFDPSMLTSAVTILDGRRASTRDGGPTRSIRDK